MLKGKLNVDLQAVGRFLRPRTPPMIGVDISTSAIKFVELEDAGKGRYRIERYTIEPLPRDAVVDGSIVNLDQVKQVKPHTNGECFLVLDSGSQVKVSRSYRDVVARFVH